jgi:hypothetical protein
LELESCITQGWDTNVLNWTCWPIPSVANWTGFPSKLIQLMVTVWWVLFINVT